LYNLKIFSNKTILHKFHHITIILVSLVFMGLYNVLFYATSNVKILPKFSESLLLPSSEFMQFFFFTWIWKHQAPHRKLSNI